MHASGLILTLTGSLAAALTIGFITQRLGLSPIVGYLLAGLIVGPYTPGFVADRVLWCDQPNCRRVHRLTDIESSAVSVYRMAGCGACAIAWGVANAQSQDALLGSRQG